MDPYLVHFSASTQKVVSNKTCCHKDLHHLLLSREKNMANSMETRNWMGFVITALLTYQRVCNPFLVLDLITLKRTCVRNLINCEHCLTKKPWHKGQQTRNMIKYMLLLCLNMSIFERTEGEPENMWFTSWKHTSKGYFKVWYACGALNSHINHTFTWHIMMPLQGLSLERKPGLSV